jgi:DNA helicase-2/ATP-dependent DNA helicase PcrA
VAEIDLLDVYCGSVTTPAGCGNSQLIADSLSRHSGRKPILILTHTNAGVAALRSRLDRAEVKSSSYRLATLDGWALRTLKTFPARSETDIDHLDPPIRATTILRLSERLQRCSRHPFR